MLLLKLPGGGVLHTSAEIEVLRRSWPSGYGLRGRCRHAYRCGGCRRGSHLLKKLLMCEVLLFATRAVLLEQRRLSLLVAQLRLGLEGFLELEDFLFVSFTPFGVLGVELGLIRGEGVYLLRGPGTGGVDGHESACTVQHQLRDIGRRSVLLVYARDERGARLADRLVGRTSWAVERAARGRTVTRWGC